MISNERDRELLQSLQKPIKPIFGNAAERTRYSLARALSALAARSPSSAGFEAEVSQELERRGTKPRLGNSLLIPPDVLQRNLTTTVPGAGGYLVETSIIGLVELARPRSVLLTLGAASVDGLKGNATIPRLSTAPTIAWLSSQS